MIDVVGKSIQETMALALAYCGSMLGYSAIVPQLVKISQEWETREKCIAFWLFKKIKQEVWKLSNLRLRGSNKIIDIWDYT